MNLSETKCNKFIRNEILTLNKWTRISQRRQILPSPPHCCQNGKSGTPGISSVCSKSTSNVSAQKRTWFCCAKILVGTCWNLEPIKWIGMRLRPQPCALAQKRGHNWCLTTPQTTNICCDVANISINVR